MAALRSYLHFLDCKALQEAFEYYGKKGARDTLIESGLAKDCLSLDVRILGLLKKVGVKVKGSLDRVYEDIEKELIRKVAGPLKISGARLERILFQNYKAILKELNGRKL